jgi:DNA-binding response OmpR family regulator
MSAKRILIADDESEIRIALRQMLEQDGHEIEEAADGRAALFAIRQWRPDVLLLDLEMPMFDGVEVLKELKGFRHSKPPRVIVMSENSSTPVAVQVMRLGAVDFLQKPLAIDVLREAFSTALADDVTSNPPEGPSRLLTARDSALLTQARNAMKFGNYQLAESLLIEAEDRLRDSADYLNLLGLYHESQRQFRLAKKFYTRAIEVDGQYEPARTNLWRLREMNRLSPGVPAAAIGDDATDAPPSPSTDTPQDENNHRRF